MKLSNLSKVVWASTLATSVAVVSVALPGVAQVNTGADTDTGTTETFETDDLDAEDDGFDWGLLGLLGLAGLAGLMRKNEEPTRYRDPNVDPASTSRSDYR